MHEFSIVVGIVNSVNEVLQSEKANEVKRIDLAIGKLSGIEFQAFENAWPIATQGTVLEKSQRVIQQIPGKAKCNSCGEVYGLREIYTLCPVCQGYSKEILSGKELKLISIEVN